MRIGLVFLSLLFTFEAFSLQQKVFLSHEKNAPSVRKSETIVVNYTMPSSQLNLFKKQTKLFALKELSTGQFHQVKLNKIEKNSALMRGQLSGKRLKTDTKIAIYDLTDFNGSFEKRIKKLEQYTAMPMSVVVRRFETGLIVDLFDSAEEAISTYNLRNQMESNDLSLKPRLSPVITGLDFRQTNLVNQGVDPNLVKANDQIVKVALPKLTKMLKQEKTRRQTVKIASRNWPRYETEARIRKAKEFVKEAFLLTKDKTYKLATEYFYNASNLAPQSELIYQHYGISLHRLEKYELSLVVLSLVDGLPDQQYLRDFYIGLNYFKLKQWKEAKKRFALIDNRAPINYQVKANFYLGVILDKQEQYKLAAEKFQFVIDKSKDPKLEDLSESYIEKGLKRQELAKNKAKRWSYQGFVGLFYDSNIVLAIDGQANRPTDQEGLRFLTSNKLRFDYHKTQKHDLGARVEATLMNSVKNDFGSSDVLEAADPWVFAFDLPWNYRGKLFDKAYSFELAPKYEVIMMDLDARGKKDIIHSTAAQMSNQWVAGKSWIATGDFEFRIDDANSSTGTITEEADATKYSVSLGAIFILGDSKTTYLIPKLNWSLNNAEGDDFAYDRLGLSLSYSQKIWGDLSWMTQAGFHQTDYKSIRKDENLSFSSGVSLPFSDNLQWGLTGSYQDNQSNTNAFDKVQIFTTFSFKY